MAIGKNSSWENMLDKSREIFEEFRVVVSGQNSVLDAILPPIVFLLLNGLMNFQAAMYGALILSIIIAIFRLLRKQSLWYALAGIGSVLVAIALVWVLGKSEGFFLPGLVSGSMTLLLAILSLVIRRPMVAWTSYIARRWPLEWYWHPEVRPAYSEVTFAWVIFFALRLYLQFSFFQQANTSMLAVTNFITGWPATILLLVLSYLYGTWRLANLHGPSVEEFKTHVPAPWQSQKRGF
ncbi:MAG: DUF3159 domain-containing protein [Chloroflexi bacterium]|nr:DUF3159 domain-containing protein [Chloroflexota bacterium]